MTRTGWPFLLVTLGPLAACGGASLDARPYPVQNVCQITASPGDFVGRTVTVTGNVFTDHIHGSGLADRRCSQLLKLTATGETTPGDMELRRTIRGTRGTDQHVNVTITGLIERCENVAGCVSISPLRYDDIRMSGD